MANVSKTAAVSVFKTGIVVVFFMQYSKGIAFFCRYASSI